MKLRLPARARRTCFLVLAGVALWALGSGCEEDGGDPWRPIVPELVPTAPESVVAHLVRSYRTRDIEAYAGLLAPEFRFRFQPIDQVVVGSVYWTHDQDSLGTRGLFWAPVVSDIRLQLTHGPSTLSGEAQHQLDHPGARRILITGTRFEVDQNDGITWLVTDQQEMFFYRGTAEAGEDTTRWFLFEWRDLPGVNAGAPGPGPESNVAVESITWGKIKAQYR